MKKIFSVLIITLLISACSTTPPPLLPPVNIAYVLAGDNLKLVWDEVANADSYYVHISPTGTILPSYNNWWETTITEETYPSGNYAFSITTLSQGRESAPSEAITITINWPTPEQPEEPTPEEPVPDPAPTPEEPSVPEVPEEPTPEPETYVIGGILQEDTTLSDTTMTYVIDNYLQIPYGVTLSIEPGVQVSQGSIQVWGNLQVVGTPSNHVILDSVDIVGRGNDYTAEYYNMVFNYVTFTGEMDILSPTGNSSHGSFYLGHSIVEAQWGWVYMWYPVGETVIEYNTFHNYVYFDIGFDGRTSTNGNGRNTVEIRNNTFSWGRISNWVAYGETPLILRNNNLIDVQVELKSNYPSTQIDARRNYWGTTDENIIQTRITDRNDSLEYNSVIPYTPFLMSPVGTSEEHTINITMVGDAPSRVVISTGDTCSEDCSVQVAVGSTVTLTANEDYFIGWTGDYCHDSTSTTCIISGFTEDVNISALFYYEPEPYVGCVDINSANEEELQEIIHIGPVRAVEVIEKRTYQYVRQLTRVTGIGSIRIEDIIKQGVACTATIAYIPHPSTVAAVYKAANFTDGIIIECPDIGDTAEVWRVCVDGRDTGWNQYQLANWSDYGFSYWLIYEEWHVTDEDTLQKVIVNLDTKELMLIWVFTNKAIVYNVTSIDNTDYSVLNNFLLKF